MEEVLQDARLEEPEQLGPGAVAGERQPVVVRGDPRNEAGDPDHEEDERQ